MISMWLPKDAAQTFDDIAARTGRIRNAILSLSLKPALEHLDLTVESAQKNIKPKKEPGSENT